MNFTFLISNLSHIPSNKPNTFIPSFEILCRIGIHIVSESKCKQYVELCVRCVLTRGISEPRDRNDRGCNENRCQKGFVKSVLMLTWTLLYAVSVLGSFVEYTEQHHHHCHHHICRKVSSADPPTLRLASSPSIAFPRSCQVVAPSAYSDP